MKRVRSQAIAALVAGALFGVGLAVSGMTKPTKVIAFLDVFGQWDPSLMFVMMGAIAVHVIAYRVIKRRTTPLFSAKFTLPTRRDIDLKLVVGAALFGIGWGLGGYCPGPALVSVASGGVGVLVFAIAMVAGMSVTARVEDRLARRGEFAPAPEGSSVAQGTRESTAAQ